jgi:photosystem II stability/assembly factor-like uncharacterized protein
MRIRFIFTFLLAVLTTSTTSAQTAKELPKLYQQLLDEGWHRKEIDQLMQSYLQQSSGLPSPKNHPATPLPSPNWDLLENVSQIHTWANEYQDAYTTFTNTYPGSKNTTTIQQADRIEPNMKVKRQRGLWKHVAMHATAGRIYDIELHPENEKVMYANPDGDGIFKTEDGGHNWYSISDNIPDRLHRNAYENIMVDPHDFNRVFLISRFGHLYKTTNGGNDWQSVKNSNHPDGKAPQFKWVEAVRNATNTLILIGTVTKNSGLNHGWEKGIYRSVDDGQSWTKINLKDDKLQEMAFHKTKKDVIYLANTNRLYKSMNSGESFELVHDFKFGNRPMFITTLSSGNTDGLYVALSKNDHTQVHFSADQGVSWELRQDSENKIGFEKGIFGHHGSSSWTSFFEVDPFDENHLIASNVGSCESFDGGKNWEYQAWHTRALAQMPDGSRTLAPHGSHNADNHVLKFHPRKKGWMVKGCDAGIMMKEAVDTNWVNINGNMPAFLWYSVVVNEFGDRYIAGNTQDVNIQTYRYNHWENDRGYEGDAIFMNPSTNTTYYPVAKTEKGEGLNFLEPGFWKMHSWNYPKVAPNYKNLDQIFIAYGRRPTEPEPQLPKYLYLTNNRGISFERVPNMEDKEVFSINVSRTPETILTAFTATDVMTSINQGETWETKNYPIDLQGNKKSRKVSACVNPDQPEQLWIGGTQGEVFSSMDGGQSWHSIKGSLPDGDVLELLHHEGTGGDLYALVHGYGVFYKAADASDWQLWMNGFNLADFTEIRIDYPCQKLLASSYGRGLWEADLEKTVDRFFTNENLKIVANGKLNKKHVFTLDSDFQLPDYYNFKWRINGKGAGENTNTLIVDKVKSGDEITLVISPIYSTDIEVSTKHIVTESKKHQVEKAKNNALFLKDHFIDAGYVDLFGAHADFTISTWIKPITEGVIAGNRRTFYRDAKGWYLEVTKAGQLHFNAAFYQNRSLEKTFNKGIDQSLSVSSTDSVISFNEWANITVTVNRMKGITLYVNHKVVGTQALSDIPASLSLNSVMNLTLLADTYGKRKMIGEIKNFSVYTNELSPNEVKQASKKGRHYSENLAFFIDFEKATPAKELYRNRIIDLKGDDYLQITNEGH